MLGSVALRSPPLQIRPGHVWEAAAGDLSSSRPSTLAPRSIIVCDAQRSYGSIPKLKPFSRSRFERWLKDPPFLQQIENEISDYCTTLEGDDCCSCWRAYFELKDLEQQWPKEDVEKLVRQVGGIKMLIDCLHGITAMRKKKEKETEPPKPVTSCPQTETPVTSCPQTERPFPVPDGLPPTQEELEEAEKARMPDSPFTRLLRSKGKFPAWYIPRPDHETD
ncbi:hypothetical protein OPV22_004417 [Ensete ventricosum]|uniref:CCG-binding protein 1 n=1 Tax=Ensete ventricosum TaxID=4639 RepID=A0AAV8S3Q0_ENSVE|nr:hypothetical protein OPV22_004417 [Ensete ventricosum]